MKKRIGIGSFEEDQINALLTILRHREELQDGLHGLADELRRRARVHDRSKLQLDEFKGFSRINKTAREHPFGSDEYRKSMRTEQGPDGCITLHFKRNSHHPEYHPDPSKMNFLDTIEMVFDWNAAAKTYGTNSLSESLEVQRKKDIGRTLSKQQWWLIEQVVEWIEGREIEAL